jgi:hypothetical protein
MGGTRRFTGSGGLLAALKPFVAENHLHSRAQDSPFVFNPYMSS